MYYVIKTIIHNYNSIKRIRLPMKSFHFDLQDHKVLVPFHMKCYHTLQEMDYY